MGKLMLWGAIVSLVLTGCSGVDTAHQNREAGLFTKPTVVCVVNKALQPVEVFIGGSTMAGATEVLRDYWYWGSLNNGKKNTGIVTLDTGKTVCTTSSDSDRTLTGPTDVMIRVYTAADRKEFAYFGFNNEISGRPAFFPEMAANDWSGRDEQGATQISTNEFDSYRCQVKIWDFNVIRLKDQNSNKNWKFEILGPANIEEWPEETCTKK